MVDVHIEKVTTHLGVTKWGKEWRVMDIAENAQIGGIFKTKIAACAYAFYRQEATYQ